MNDYTHYLSPYSWRYGSAEMRAIWSEVNKRRTWRKIWVVLARVQSEFGLVTPQQIDDLQAHVDNVDMKRALEIEAEIKHDVMAEIKTYAEQCKVGGGIIHLGATSMDISDNAEALRIRESLGLVLDRLQQLLILFVDKVEAYAELPVMGHTHIQPAEPTTLGYRFAQYAQDMLSDWQDIQRVFKNVRGKGFKGAVGTGASYGELLGVENIDRFETLISEHLALPFYPVATQTYPRKQEYQIISALAGLGGSLYKFAFDLRILQSPPFGELSESFGKKQVGSSAMPFKRNPISAEKIDSIGRALAQMPRLAWDNAAHSLLERTLDDSANRRTMLPETFLMVDELLKVSMRLIEGLQINLTAIERNMAAYGPFAATERVLMAVVKAGANRQDMHEHIRAHSLVAWEHVSNGHPNPLAKSISEDEIFLSYIETNQLLELMNAGDHIGFASERARLLAQTIRETLTHKEKL